MTSSLVDLARYPDRHCRTVPTSVFYPEHGSGTSRALKVCDGCPIRLACLAEVLDSVPEWEDRSGGIRGGTTPTGRHRLRVTIAARRMRAQARHQIVDGWQADLAELVRALVDLCDDLDDAADEVAA